MDLCALSLISPTHAGQRRLVRINTREPIFVEVEAVESSFESGTSLQWRTVMILSQEGSLHADTSSLPTTETRA